MDPDNTARAINSSLRYSKFSWTLNVPKSVLSFKV